MRHNEKNRYLRVADAMRAADKYTKRYGIQHRFYECDECPYFHLASVTHGGSKVVDMDAIQKNRGQGE